MRSKSASGQRLGISVHPRDRSGWLVALSLSFHLAALALLLMKPLVPPPAGASDPMPVEFITEKGPDQAPSEASTTTAPAAPEVPAQPAEASQPPASAPDVSPPVQQAEVPPAASIPIPDVVSTPQPAELPLSAQAPAPTLVPTASPLQPADLPPPPEPPLLKVPPSRPVPLARAPSSPLLPRPNRSPPQRVTTVRPAPTSDMTGTGEAPVRATEGSNSPGRTSAANNGAAWMGRLRQWWDQNSFYPREASQTNEGGNVRVHITISRDGRVTSIELVQSSGSSVLDVAALAVFRNARLPPLPPGIPPQPADVVVTLHYRPSDTGR